METNKVKPIVHILVTCDRPEHKRMSELVFETLRVGFPTFPIHVWLNPPLPDGRIAMPYYEEILPYKYTHWQWIRMLVEQNTEPFVICDTDVVFHKSIEEKIEDFIAHKNPLLGEFVPYFRDPVTKLVHLHRLHTAVMGIKPQFLQQDKSNIPHTINPPDLITPVMLRECYFDTMAVAYDFFGKFCYHMDGRGLFTHLHAGCWLEEFKRLAPKEGGELAEGHKLFLEGKIGDMEYRDALDKFYREHKA